MKKFMQLCAVAMALAFTLNRASADPVFSISGSALFYKTNYTRGSQQVATTLNYSFNNKTIYNIVSNAVANATNLNLTILPANGYIAYSLVASNAVNFDTKYDSIFYTEVVGVFYATNKSGFYFPLSGFDNNTNYYSFMELDTFDLEYGQLGFGNDFDYEGSYNVNNGSGSETDTETAVLFITDNSGFFDDADFPDSFQFANNAIEIRGILKINLSVKGGLINKGSASLSGTGNIVLGSQTYGGTVTSGTMRLQ